MIILINGSNIVSTKFNDNTADQGGAVLTYFYGSHISFKDNSTTEFNNNIADRGGAIFTYYHSSVLFTDNSAIVFRNNTAYNKGGAMIFDNSKLTFDYYSTVNFTNNKATIDATIYSTGKSNQIMVQEVGSPTIIFKDQLVNWCDIMCLSDANHTEHQINGDFAITINSNGTVRCSGEEKTFVSLSRNCGFKYLEDILANLTRNELVSISDNVIISSVILLTKLHNISIVGSKNHSIKCVSNAGLQVKHCSNITIEGLNWAECGTYTTPVINILNATDITLQNCLFQQSKGPAVVIFQSSGDVNINHCKFINNTGYRDHGAAVHYTSDTTISQATFLIFNCNFIHNDAASLVYINGQTDNTNISLYNSSFQNNHGISVYLSNNTLYINGEVMFENNVAENGAGIYVNDFSKVVFDNNSNVKFANNSVYRSGAAIFLKDYSSMLFDHNSVVTFSSNSATKYGAAVCLSNNSHVTFTGNSNVEFNDSVASIFGGSVYSEHHSSVSFEDNSTVAFHKNIGYNGGAILSRYNCIIIFGDNSTVLFNNNKAYNSGGAIFSNNCSVTIKGNSTVTFDSNTASQNGGAVYCGHHQIFMLEGNSNVTFNGNEAKDGGAVHAFNMCNIVFKENRVSGFSNNTAVDNGGVFYLVNSTLTFNENAMITFTDNMAKQNGGVLYTMYIVSFCLMETLPFHQLTMELKYMVG